MKLRPPHFSNRAFSLIEVVLALGICAFALISILGLFSVGVKSVGQSGSELQAANLASLIVAQRRADPTNASLVLALPQVNQSLTPWAETKVGWDGLPTKTVNEASNAPYLLRYRVGMVNLPANADGPKIALVCLSLSWPSGAASKNASHYELVTQIQIP